MLPNTIKSGGVETSNPCDIADAFNRFFTTIADTHVPRNNHMPESEFVTLSEHVRTKQVEVSTFVIPNVDLEYVIKRLSTQPNKATGVDGISQSRATSGPRARSGPRRRVPARYVRHSQMCPQLDMSDKNDKKTHDMSDKTRCVRQKFNKIA